MFYRLNEVKFCQTSLMLCNIGIWDRRKNKVESTWGKQIGRYAEEIWPFG